MTETVDKIHRDLSFLMDRREFCEVLVTGVYRLQDRPSGSVIFGAENAQSMRDAMLRKNKIEKDLNFRLVDLLGKDYAISVIQEKEPIDVSFTLGHRTKPIQIEFGCLFDLTEMFRMKAHLKNNPYGEFKPNGGWIPFSGSR